MSDAVFANNNEEAVAPPRAKHQHINQKLAALGQSTCRIDSDHSCLAEHGVDQRVELPGATFIIDEPGLTRDSL